MIPLYNFSRLEGEQSRYFSGYSPSPAGFNYNPLGIGSARSGENSSDLESNISYEGTIEVSSQVKDIYGDPKNSEDYVASRAAVGL